ncbi:DHS-like NAD/FAD-binding domain-containing protein [Exidia glandulosa HHB12029]|uniref:DHS-like NAD/FAD-binding domain-containing protein n=1 Tax=Exidia glandulosa HHB12029 TaxID=1314781 RepID=A0A166BFA7_EXIGL|nr:DHS-like NAD/FAD-binding domain-containing protein [Exidia glandulosa HHB12029]
MSDAADAFRDAFQNSKHIVVIAGAGLSAASGIPTFRDGGGMWRSLEATALATPEAFNKNPSLVWQFYHYRRTKALEAKPNAAHDVIAKMSVPTYLRKVAPAAQSFHLVTQNVDRLSVSALNALLARPDSQAELATKHTVFRDSILEMHGRIYDVKCTACGFCEEDRTDPLCPALGAADASFNNYHDAGSKDVHIPENDLPRCAACGALARPGVVWFGEKPYHLDEINSIVYKADMCLVIGTSSTVRPASTYAYRVQRHGGKVAVFNLAPSEKDEQADFVFSGPCETILPSLFPELA